MSALGSTGDFAGDADNTGNFQGNIPGDRGNKKLPPVVWRNLLFTTSIVGYSNPANYPDLTFWSHFVDPGNGFFNSMDPNTNCPSTDYNNGGPFYFPYFGNPIYDSPMDPVALIQTPMQLAFAAMSLSQVPWNQQWFVYQHRLGQRKDNGGSSLAGGLGAFGGPCVDGNPVDSFLQNIECRGSLTDPNIQAMKPGSGVLTPLPGPIFLEPFSAYDNSILGPFQQANSAGAAGSPLQQPQSYQVWAGNLNVNSENLDPYAGARIDSSGSWLIANRFFGQRSDVLFLAAHAWTITQRDYAGGNAVVISNGNAKYGDIVPIPMPPIGRVNFLTYV